MILYGLLCYYYLVTWTLFRNYTHFLAMCHFNEAINVSFLFILFYFISASEMNNTEGAIAAFQTTANCYIVLATEKTQQEARDACKSLGNALCRHYDNDHFNSGSLPLISTSDNLQRVS